jgi:hypothetical protein
MRGRRYRLRISLMTDHCGPQRQFDREMQLFILELVPGPQLRPVNDRYRRALLSKHVWRRLLPTADRSLD